MMILDEGVNGIVLLNSCSSDREMTDEYSHAASGANHSDVAKNSELCMKVFKNGSISYFTVRSPPSINGFRRDGTVRVLEKTRETKAP